MRCVAVRSMIKMYKTSFPPNPSRKHTRGKRGKVYEGCADLQCEFELDKASNSRVRKDPRDAIKQANADTKHKLLRGYKGKKARPGPKWTTSTLVPAQEKPGAKHTEAKLANKQRVKGRDKQLNKHGVSKKMRRAIEDFERVEHVEKSFMSAFAKYRRTGEIRLPSPTLIAKWRLLPAVDGKLRQYLRKLLIMAGIEPDPGPNTPIKYKGLLACCRKNRAAAIEYIRERRCLRSCSRYSSEELALIIFKMLLKQGIEANPGPGKKLNVKRKKGKEPQSSLLLDDFGVCVHCGKVLDGTIEGKMPQAVEFVDDVARCVSCQVPLDRVDKFKYSHPKWELPAKPSAPPVTEMPECPPVAQKEMAVDPPPTVPPPMNTDGASCSNTAKDPVVVKGPPPTPKVVSRKWANPRQIWNYVKLKFGAGPDTTAYVNCVLPPPVPETNFTDWLKARSEHEKAKKPKKLTGVKTTPVKLAVGTTLAAPAGKGTPPKPAPAGKGTPPYPAGAGKPAPGKGTLPLPKVDTSPPTPPAVLRGAVGSSEFDAKLIASTTQNERNVFFLKFVSNYFNPPVVLSTTTTPLRYECEKRIVANRGVTETRSPMDVHTIVFSHHTYSWRRVLDMLVLGSIVSMLFLGVASVYIQTFDLPRPQMPYHHVSAVLPYLYCDYVETGDYLRLHLVNNICVPRLSFFTLSVSWPSLTWWSKQLTSLFPEARYDLKAFPRVRPFFSLMSEEDLLDYELGETRFTLANITYADRHGQRVDPILRYQIYKIYYNYLSDLWLATRDVAVAMVVFLSIINGHEIVTKRIKYVPHLVSCVLNEYQTAPDIEFVKTSVRQKLLRQATLPLPDVDSVALMDGSELAVIQACQDSYFRAILPVVAH